MASTDEDIPAGGSGRAGGRVAAALLLAAGTACLLAALAASGGVAALLLDAMGSSTGAGDCAGALVVPALLLAGSALGGLVGTALTAASGVLFWRITGMNRV